VLGVFTEAPQMTLVKPRVDLALFPELRRLHSLRAVRGSFFAQAVGLGIPWGTCISVLQPGEDTEENAKCKRRILSLHSLSSSPHFCCLLLGNG